LINENDFFEILQFLKEGDNGDVPEEVRNLANNTKIRTQNFFSRVIDQVPFNSSDYNRLRKMLIDWYSSLATFQDLQKTSSDASSLPHNLLNRACRGFGFAYADGIGTRIDKALFLYSLCELYKIKGTPKSMKSALEFFGVYDVQIYEWWLKNDPVLDQLFIHSKPIDLGGIEVEKLEIQKVPYNQFKFDNHWWYTEQEIKDIDNQSCIALPSITPYFSIQASANILKLKQLYGIIARKINDEYVDVHDNLIPLDRVIFVETYNINLSILELILSISHIYNTWSGRTYGSNSPNYEYYQGDETDFDVIVDEYNQVLRRPPDRDRAKELQAEYLLKFTKLQSENFIQNPTDVSDILNEVNPTVLEWLNEILASSDDIIISTLATLMKEFDIYIRMQYGIQVLSFSNMLLGLSDESIDDVINFFKPKRARLISFNLIYAIDDPLHHAITMAEIWDHNIRQYHPERYIELEDELNRLNITHTNRDYYNCEGSSLENFDMGNYFDSIPWVCLHDSSEIIIRQPAEDIIPHVDYLNEVIPTAWYADSYNNITDKLNITNILKFDDIAFRVRENDFHPCGIPGWPYPDRTKTYDIGYIYDVDEYICKDTTGELIVLPDWYKCVDPERICINEWFRERVEVQFTDVAGSGEIGVGFETLEDYWRDEIVITVIDDGGVVPPNQWYP